jgi:hypothetical protein
LEKTSESCVDELLSHASNTSIDWQRSTLVPPPITPSLSPSKMNESRSNDLATTETKEVKEDIVTIMMNNSNDAKRGGNSDNGLSVTIETTTDVKDEVTTPEQFVELHWIEHLLVSPNIWLRKGRSAASILTKLLAHNPRVPTLMKPFTQPQNDHDEYHDYMDLLQDVTRNNAMVRKATQENHRRRFSYGYHVTTRIAKVLAPAMAKEACNIFVMASLPRIGNESSIHRHLFGSDLFDRNVSY